MFFDRASYPAHRRILYALAWCVAAVELGLTSDHIHKTRLHYPIVAELLTTACLTIIWAPLAIVFHRRSSSSRVGGLHFESIGTFVLWCMWLVGGGIATHRWPNRAVLGPGHNAHIVLAAVAFGLTSLGIFTLVAISILMEYSAIYASSASSNVAATYRGAAMSEKGPNPNPAVA
ncbi:hypothetical protein FB45DRAFT_1126102 [Roridomyces roridus]|uniref:Uncharacterized protein n=1 Tax=Roridomyces roridus TaxID=1738132 RepID=A0AAD7FTB9_9AGAR|nr:hypothetical protein FB45DRAFT_1126102 [Roridomyces roridus]